MSKEDKRELTLHDKLIEACRKNDRKAQTRIYDMYYRSMFNISFRLVKNAMIAEDIMQETFLSAFSKLNSFRAEVTFGAWLKRITINKSIDYLKKKKIEFDELNENIQMEADDNQIDEEINKNKARQIIEMIDQLPSGFQIIMKLYLIEGYDHEEISSILGITASTSRSQYTRAKRKLLQLLSNT